MKRSIYLTILFIILNNYVQSAHITGGKFRFTYINANYGKLQLELERNCDGNGATFETTVEVGIYSESNNSKVASLTLTRDTIINAPIITDCNGTVKCFEQANYSIQFNIFQLDLNYYDSIGYYFYWERCCLANGIVNIENSAATPMGILLNIPKFTVSETNKTQLVNSSPYFPFTFNPNVCINKELIYNLSFIDPDGDSLVYEVSTSNAGGYTSIGNPGQNDGPKPYDTVQWSIGYNINNIINSNPPLELNKNTGILKITPTQFGKFLISFAIHEYRNGLKIGTVYYGTNLFVINCVEAIIKQPKDQYSVNYSAVTFRVKPYVPLVNYQWQLKVNSSFNNIPSANSDTLLVDNITDSMNNYIYRCVIKNGTCVVPSDEATLHVLKSRIENNNTTKLKLYPNPTNSQVTIQGIENPTKISVYSLEGKLLKEIFNALSVDVSDLEPGLYLVRATDEKNNSNYYGKLRVGE